MGGISYYKEEKLRRNYFEILEVSTGASPAEITKAYRRLAMELHPDRNPNDTAKEEKFRAIAEAYAILDDPLKREEYELGIRAALTDKPQSFLKSFAKQVIAQARRKDGEQ